MKRFYTFFLLFILMSPVGAFTINFNLNEEVDKRVLKYKSDPVFEKIYKSHFQMYNKTLEDNDFHANFIKTRERIITEIVDEYEAYKASGEEYDYRISALGRMEKECSDQWMEHDYYLDGKISMSDINIFCGCLKSQIEERRTREQFEYIVNQTMEMANGNKKKYFKLMLQRQCYGNVYRACFKKMKEAVGSRQLMKNRYDEQVIPKRHDIKKYLKEKKKIL